jgi:hypothetical protein
MRDARFIAAHRGGSLSRQDHQLLAAWAADCAEHVLCHFPQSCDERPRYAIAIARSWSRGEIPVGTAQKASIASHAAARAQEEPAAIAAARAAGHAVATAHMADHSLGAVIYGIKATRAAGRCAQTEYDWQLAQAPDHLRDLIANAIVRRLGKPLV